MTDLLACGKSFRFYRRRTCISELLGAMRVSRYRKIFPPSQQVSHFLSFHLPIAFRYARQIK